MREDLGRSDNLPGSDNIHATPWFRFSHVRPLVDKRAGTARSMSPKTGSSGLLERFRSPCMFFVECSHKGVREQINMKRKVNKSLSRVQPKAILGPTKHNHKSWKRKPPKFTRTSPSVRGVRSTCGVYALDRQERTTLSGDCSAERKLEA